MTFELKTECKQCLISIGNSVRIIYVLDKNRFKKYDTFLCKNCIKNHNYTPIESELVDELSDIEKNWILR